MDNGLSGHSQHKPTAPTKPQDSKVAPRKNINESSDAAAKFRRHAPETNDKPPQRVHFSEKSLGFALVAVGTEPNDPLTGPRKTSVAGGGHQIRAAGAAVGIGASSCGLGRRVAATETKVWVRAPDAGYRTTRASSRATRTLSGAASSTGRRPATCRGPRTARPRPLLPISEPCARGAAVLSAARAPARNVATSSRGRSPRAGAASW